jgi:hypothetical protein
MAVTPPSARVEIPPPLEWANSYGLGGSSPSPVTVAPSRSGSSDSRCGGSAYGDHPSIERDDSPGYSPSSAMESSQSYW